MQTAMIELPSNALEEAAESLAGIGPVSIINLVRYRKQADYGGTSETAPCTGREAYLQRYAPAFAKVAKHVAPSQHYAPVFIGSVRAMLLLRAILESPEYEAQAAPHRRAALEEWCFIASTQTRVPN
jgi:hypothetical protein